MGVEVDLLRNYPRAKRDVEGRGVAKSEEDRRIAREFGKEFFDGDRRHGYGGFRYDPRFWQPVVPDLQQHFGLQSGSRLLDVGCAKGFMLYDLQELIPGIHVQGIDISEYAVANGLPAIQSCLQVGSALELPFDDDSFDVVISINTVHNFDADDVVTALKEIERVGRGKGFITVDAYRTEEEKERIFNWNLTAKTVLSCDGWIKLFESVGYTGDYYWFIP